MSATGGGTETGGGGGILFNGLTYKEVLAEDGKIWLDRNLGALQVAQAYNDHLAYGDLYQWGRGSDGHEKITHSGPSAGTPQNGSTAIMSAGDTPGNALFITTSTAPYSWRITPNNNLWATSTGKINNPCPTNFHVPTQAEWQTWYNAIPSFATCAGGGTCHTVARNSALKLPLAGYRDRSDASLKDLGGYGLYWSSSVSGTNACNLYFNSGGVYPSTAHDRATGFSVRCLKD